MSDFDSRGKFALGNKAAKKDFSKELAKHAVKQEINWVSNFLCNASMEELEELKSSGELKTGSIMLNIMVESAVKGDVKSLTWLCEMLIGKPKQQIDQAITSHAIKIIIDSEDENL